MIRQATASDNKTIVSLWLETSLQAHDFIKAEYWQNAASYVEEKLLPVAETYLYLDKRKLKGFISIVDGAYIGALFVKKAYQGQGIGKKLLDYVKRKKSSLSLRVYIKNKQALRFYQNYGFKILREEVDDATGEAELFMVWSMGCASGHFKRHQGDS